MICYRYCINQGLILKVFPTLEDYLYQTVSTLPYQSLLWLALDSVFEEFPEISAIQTKVYRMLKCHLSIINHPSITQFDDISLANHDFDRVVGPDFHTISGAESRPDLSLHTDFNDTYYSVFSQAQCQVYRVLRDHFVNFVRIELTHVQTLFNN